MIGQPIVSEKLYMIESQPGRYLDLGNYLDLEISLGRQQDFSGLAEHMFLHVLQYAVRKPLAACEREFDNVPIPILQRAEKEFWIRSVR